jgi:nucleoside-diphosphate-sugar epimerase
VQIARNKGVSGYVGDGQNRWNAVHRDDAARLFRLAVENAPAGSVLHAVGEEAIAVRDLATVIGEHLDVPVTSVPPEGAAEHFGWLGAFLAVDAPASSAITQELLGWRPTGPGLLEDVAAHYV